MITIKMHQGKWRIILGSEIWEFNTNENFQEVLGWLLGFKDDFGRLDRVGKLEVRK